MSVKPAYSCYGCPNRYPGCHSECDTHKKEKAEFYRQKDEEYKRNLLDSQIRQLKYAAIDKPEKHRIFKRSERK